MTVFSKSAKNYIFFTNLFVSFFANSKVVFFAISVFHKKGDRISFSPKVITINWTSRGGVNSENRMGRVFHTEMRCTYSILEYLLNFGVLTPFWSTYSILESVLHFGVSTQF